MDKKEYLVVGGLIVFFSLLGSALSNWLFSSEAAMAAEMPMTSGTESQSLGAISYQKVVKTEMLEIVAKGGKTLGRFGLDQQGLPALVLFDKVGSVSASLIVRPDGNSSLSLLGKGGNMASLGIDSDGSPTLAFFDSKGTDRCVLRLEAGGDPMLAFQDAQGKTRVALGGISEKLAGKVLPVRPIDSLVLLDENQKPVWKAPENSSRP